MTGLTPLFPHIPLPPFDEGGGRPRLPEGEIFPHCRPTAAPLSRALLRFHPPAAFRFPPRLRVGGLPSLLTALALARFPVPCARLRPLRFSPRLRGGDFVPFNRSFFSALSFVFALQRLYFSVIPSAARNLLAPTLSCPHHTALVHLSQLPTQQILRSALQPLSE